MSRKRDSDCCEYREAKRLAQQKLRMKMQASKKIEKKKGDDDCDDEDEELEIEQKEKCEEKRAQRVEALAKLLSMGDEMMRRIKPSIEERDKYSMSYRHIRCLLEPAEIERMELEARMRSIFKCTPCESSKLHTIFLIINKQKISNRIKIFIRIFQQSQINSNYIIHQECTLILRSQ